MEYSGIALPGDGLRASRDSKIPVIRSPENSHAAAVAGNISLPETASSREIKIRFAIHAPLKNFSAGGWEVTDTHIVLFGKSR